MSGETQDEGVEVLQQVVSIVSAYVSHNAMRAAELPEFIGAVHASILQLCKEPDAASAKTPNVPAVPIKRSISKDFIICLEDGKKFKSLRRHLSSCYNMTPNEYRAKWGLPSDYPMVAPAYSATRSQLARDSGLGQISRAVEAAAASAGRQGKEAAADPHASADGPSAKPVVAEAADVEAVMTKPRAVKADAGEADVAQPKPSGAGNLDAAIAEPEAAKGEPVAVEAPKKAKRGRPRKVAA